MKGAPEPPGDPNVDGYDMIMPDSQLAAGFDDPLGMLYACHRRIEAKCALMRKLAAHVTQLGADDDAGEAAAQIRKYFNSAGRHHHADEETDLFPMLLALDAGSMELIGHLQSDHRDMEDAWQRLDVELLAIEQRAASQLTSALVDAFIDLYTRHIDLEDRELLTHARRLLKREHIENLGVSMARRRGVKWR